MIQAEDGLVQSQVNAVLESRDGMVWLGTFGGVSRWDGTRCENFELGDGLAGLDVRAFAETPGGDVLIATADNGICRYRDGAFTTVNEAAGLPANSTRGFHFAADGRIVVATADGLAIFADAELDTATMRRALPGTRVSGVAARRAGGCYLSTFSHGVLVWEGDAARPLLPAADLPDRIVRAVHELPDGTVLISVYHAGVWAWRDGTLARWAHNEALQGHDVMAFLTARDGTLYLSTIGGGVLVVGAEGTRRLTRAEGLPDDTSWAVHESRDGPVYIGTWDGLALYDPGRILVLNRAAGLPGENITATAELPDGRMAVAMLGTGVALCRDGRMIDLLDPADGLAHARVWSLLAARDGSLYIGTHAGLDRLRDGRVTPVYRETEAPSGRVYALHEARDGTLWLATYGGIHRVREGRTELLYYEEDGARSSVYAIAETRTGDLLFGTGGGLVTVRDGREILPPADSPLAGLHVWSVLEARDGRLLLGTNGQGLWVAERGPALEADWRVLLPVDGLSGTTVFGLAEDARGRIHAATQRGVTIFPAPGEDAPVRQLHTADGLAGEECSQGRILVDSQGRLWYSTIRGVTRYDPARDLPGSRPPRVHWRRVRLFSDELPLARFATAPEFRHDENFLRFDFVATHPRGPHRVRYRHRLSGVDPDWIEEQQTSVTYSSLQPGEYRFEVMARDEWGAWSVPATLAFLIRPPFWRTWWFTALVVLAIAGSAAALVWWRARQLLAYEQLRSRIAADLHDDIGAGLAEIGIMTSVLGAKLPAAGREAVAAELAAITTQARGLARSMSDIVWLVHPRRDSLHDLLERLADGYAGAFEAGGVRFRIEGLDQLAELPLGLERRQHLYLMFKEAVNNAVKYSGCRELRLSARVRGRRLELELTDDGRGFDAAAVGGRGNGLRNMRERARRLGGMLEIVAQPGGGTTITYRD